MPSLGESIQMCMWFDVNAISRRNLLASVVSSIFFFLGWWIIIGIAATSEKSLSFSIYLLGSLGTISFLIVNSVGNDMLNGAGAYEGGICGSHGIKIWLFSGFVLGFASIFASVWLFFSEFADSRTHGTGVVVQNFLILFSSLIFKFGRHDNDSSFGGF